MTYSEACKILNIATYPEEMDGIWEELCRTGEMPVTREMLIHFQEAYNLFADYYDAVMEGFDDLERDEARRVWVMTSCAYAKMEGRVYRDMSRLKLPETDGTPAGHMAPLFPLACLADRTYEGYRRRGFSHDETMYYLQVYRRSMGVTTHKTGKPGLQRTHYNWSTLYTYVSIFRTGGFNFQFTTSDSNIHMLRHRDTRKLAILIHDTRIHRDGMVLGTKAYEDEEGAYDTTYEETETEFIGYPAVDFHVPNQKQHFSKSEWELVISPGDHVFGLHIPGKTNLAPECVAAAIDQALDIAAERFPEFEIKGLRCSSWLLSAQLDELLGSESRIVRFSNLFTRFPFKDSGMGVFGFAFDGIPADYNDLPENTSLQRKVKALYLSGGYVYSYGGYILDKIQA